MLQIGAIGAIRIAITAPKTARKSLRKFAPAKGPIEIGDPGAR